MNNKNKKISLLTFHSALSYGAVIQTYALTKTLESFNFKVEIINFKAPFLPKRPTGLWSLKNEYGSKKRKKRKLFKTFRNKYLKNETKKLNTLKSLNSYPFNSDFYIVGSDQVWNPTITKKFNEVYFFNFVNGHKIAYAASFGKEEWNYDSSYTKKIKSYLEQFNTISVREKSGKKLLNENFNLDSTVVLDPSFLYQDYHALFKNFKQKKQLVSFKLNYNNKFLDLVSTVQKKLNIPTYAIDFDKKHKNIKPIGFPSVTTWLQTIAESSFVITDSFHGLVFSLIFQKNFIVVNAHPKRFTRIQSLLEILNLTDRIVTSEKQTNLSSIIDTNIDYISVNKILHKLREQSLNFLKNNLK